MKERLFVSDGVLLLRCYHFNLLLTSPPFRIHVLLSITHALVTQQSNLVISLYCVVALPLQAITPLHYLITSQSCYPPQLAALLEHYSLYPF